MKALQRKLKSRLGFTLAEVLMVILILALVGSVVVSGIPAAINAYRKVVDGANAQLLLSTTVSSLRHELALAKEIKTTGNKVVSYTNGETGYETTLKKPDEEMKGIYRVYPGTNRKPELLVTEAAATKDMIITFDEITYDKDQCVFSVTGLTVTKNDKPLAKLDDPLLIRAVMGLKTT